jgi:mRNA interferase MazF
VKRGEIWWLEEPDRSARPVCVLTRTEAIQALGQILVVPATTTVRRIDSEVALDRSDGMPKACVLSLDNTTLMPKEFLTREITTLSPARMHEVCEALRFATACG